MKNILCVFMIFVGFVYAGTDGTVRGRVIDETGQPMASAQVFIKELGKGTMADLDGNYILLNIPVGKYDVHCMVIGYKEKIVTDVDIIMDQTVWLNFDMQVSAVQGDAITVTSERQMVEKDVTAKKITMSSDAIQSLPIRSASDLYSLQSGVVRVQSKAQGIPGHEERGLEEIHVRGGRAGEIAYMIDGMYIRNPIYGGIGSGTRLNLFAIAEWDWQPGGFSAEYGDAMSALSNYHTSTGKSDFVFKTKFETSAIGGALGSEYDELRNFNDTNIGFGGPLPLLPNLTFWVSAQNTEMAYRVLEFDDKVYDPDSDGWDPLNNPDHQVEPWDNVSGFRGFGFDNTNDIFTKFTYKPTNSIRTNLSYWKVANHRKIFSPTFMYWDNGQNELFRDTYRWAFEFNHSLNEKTFYTVRLSQFNQGQFQGVRWEDNDQDGYPDWFEWRYPAGSEAGYVFEEAQYSDPEDPNIVPYQYINGRVEYTNRDAKSGWYYGAAPGDYSWDNTEEFIDENNNDLYDMGEPFLDANKNGRWDEPVLTDKAVEKDGSYWLTPDMYENYENYTGWGKHWMEFGQDPYDFYNTNGSFDYQASFQQQLFNEDSLYFLGWDEGRAFGGSDTYFANSNADTREIRFDATSQLTNKWKLRLGIDYKTHLLNYYEVQNPWSENAFVQQFAEAFTDYDGDGEWSSTIMEPFEDIGNGVFDSGVEVFLDRNKNGVYDEGEQFQDEGNGEFDWLDCNDLQTICDGDIGWDAETMGNDVFDLGEEALENYDDWNGDGLWTSSLSEPFDDANNNGKWDFGREPIDLSGYIQNTFEVPWMVINAGMRFDYTNFKTRLWSDPFGEASPYLPYYYNDNNGDGQWNRYETDGNDQWDWIDINENGEIDSEDQQEYYQDYNFNGIYDYGEPFTDSMEPIGTDAGISNATVLFTDTEYLFRLSPRIGFSHVITDQATFTFNYGVYYQNPVFMNIYVNTNNLGDPFNLFQTDDALVGNPSMTPARTESYEYALNIQLNRNIAFNLGAWVKNMDQLTSMQKYRSGTQDYWVMKNYDFGRAQGIDFMVQTRGLPVNLNMQYTWSEAKSNEEHDWSRLGVAVTDAPAEEYLMSYDRTHDLSLTLSTFMPGGIIVSMTSQYQTGAPYTPLEQAAPGSNIIQESEFKNSVRMPDWYQTNMSFSKYMKFGDSKVSLGLSIYNLFDRRNAIDIFRLTGSPRDPGDYYDRFVGLPNTGLNKVFSQSYYDTPWNESSAREINAFIRVDFN